MALSLDDLTAKVDNGGVTPDGLLTAEEYNTLLAAVKENAENSTDEHIGSVVVENTLSALDENSNKPVNSQGIASAIEAASNNLKARGYIYMGVATPTTTPDVSGGKVFYLAAQAGKYPNFDTTIASDMLTSLAWNGERWIAVRIADLVTHTELESYAQKVGDYPDMSVGLASDLVYGANLEYKTLTKGRLFDDEVEGKLLIERIEGNTIIDGDTLKSTTASAINFSDSTSIALPINSLFPTGMKRAGTAYDELTTTQKIQRVGEVDLGALSWNYNSASKVFYATLGDAKNAFTNVICPRYTAASWEEVQKVDKTIIAGTYIGIGVHIHDDSFAGDTVAFKAAMSGVMLHYKSRDEQVTSIEDALPVSVAVSRDTTYSIDEDSAPLIVDCKSSIQLEVASLVAMRSKWAWSVDHSNEFSFSLPIPRKCAKVNIISDTGLATTKTDDKKCILEYYDDGGNYFRKYIVLNAQGTSSMSYVEKNQSIDIFNDVDCEESCDIIFGNWVAQDSFHLKCYYIDVFRGISNVAYNFAEECIKYFGIRTNRLIFDRDSTSETNGTGDFATDFGDGALCHPDGFPFEMYVNGEYYGLFAWNLKKHRANYSMKSKEYDRIILDGAIDNSILAEGSIQWNMFEIRNPKELLTQSGAEYDGESPTEIMGRDSSYYDESNPICVGSAITKDAIMRLSTAATLIKGESTTSDKKAKAEEFFDIPALCLYMVIANVIYHVDGTRKNWIWTIIDGKAAPNIYDCDSVFGRNAFGLAVTDNSTTGIIGVNAGTLNYYANIPFALYKSETSQYYIELRKAGIISIDNIMRHLYNWIDRCGIKALQRNLSKWNCPSYRSPDTPAGNSVNAGGMYDSPYRIKKWLEARITSLDAYFGYTAS